MREVEKAPESNAAVQRSEYRELWLKSDRTEFLKLRDASTFTPVDEMPAGHKVIGCKLSGRGKVTSRAKSSSRSRE